MKRMLTKVYHKRIISSEIVSVAKVVESAALPLSMGGNWQVKRVINPMFFFLVFI